jgi:AcrR family transcriptional regulator
MTDPTSTTAASTAPAAGALTGPAMARARRADAQRNVEKLVAAARQAFAAEGPNASLDDIARKAGVGSGTLYRHFPTRVSLLEAVYRDGVERLCEEGNRLVETDLPPDEALVSWLHEFVGYAAVKRGLAGPLTSALGHDSGLFTECRTMLQATGGLLLRRAQEAGLIRSDVATYDILRLASAIAHAGEMSPEGAALSERLLAIAMDGLRRS